MTQSDYSKVGEAPFQTLHSAIADNTAVCDTNPGGIQRFGNMRAGFANQKMAAEPVEVGLNMLVAVLVGVIAAGFVRQVAKLVALRDKPGR